MRMLSTLAAIAGAKKPMLSSTRVFVDELRADTDRRSAESADSAAAVEASRAAEAMLGGPA